MPFSDYIPEDFKLFWRNPIMAHVNVPLDFQFSFYEANNQPLQWSLTNAPVWMSIDQYGRVTGNPTVRDHLVGVNVTVKVERPQGMLLSISRTFNIKVYDSDLGDTKVRFVSQIAGNDANPGTFSLPWRNILKPLSLLTTGVGQLIYVRGGIYTEAYNWETGGVVAPFNSKNYSPTNHLEIRSYPGEIAILDCNYFGHGFWPYLASYVAFVNLYTRRGAGPGFNFTSATNCIASGCVTYENDWDYSRNCSGMQLRGKDNLIDRCVAYSNYDRLNPTAAGTTNNMNFILYAEDGDVPVGGTLWLLNSKAWDSIANFKIKHPGDKRIIVHNVEGFDASYGWIGISQYSSIRYGVFWNNNQANTSLSISDSNTGVWENGFMLVEHTTNINSGSAEFQIQNAYATVNPVEMRYNIFYNSLAAAGVIPGNDQLYQLWIYTATNIAQARQLLSDYNVFFSPSSANIIVIGDGTGGSRNRSFANWQADGKDTHSRFGDPAFLDLVGRDFGVPLGSNAASIMNNEYAGAFKPGKTYKHIGIAENVLVEFQFPGDFSTPPPPPPPVIDVGHKRLHSQYGLARL